MSEFEKILEDEVRSLIKRPDLIEDAWTYGGKNDSGFGPDWRLFSIVSKSGKLEISSNGGEDVFAGCLTQIRQEHDRVAFDHEGEVNPELTALIEADKRLPKDFLDIKVEDLPLFKKYQLALHKYYEGHKDKKLLIEELSKI